MINGFIERKPLDDPDWVGCPYACKITEEGKEEVERELALEALAK
jgi:hypothetical protein